MKIAEVVSVVRDKDVVTTKRYWEVDIRLSESAKKLIFDDLEVA